MNIKLIDISKPLTEAWQEEFWNYAPETPELKVTVHCGSIFDHPCDAIVSPANSFGFMNGGLDYYLSEYLGWHVQDRVQEKIQQEYDGELLVGQSLIVPTDNVNFPYLISAPTMRVPLVLSSGTKVSHNIYLAAKSIFVALKKNPHIQSVAIPGLGTGVGGVSPKDCAEKMRMAFQDFYLNEYKFPKTLGDSTRKHWEETKVKQLNGEAI